MKTLIYLLSIFLFVLLQSCSFENPVNPIDSQLEQNLIGTWKGSQGYSITFYRDGTFIDTTYSEGRTDSSYINYARIVRKGQYSINNSILNLINFYFSKIDTKAKEIGYEIYELGYQISFEQGILIMIPVEILKSLESINTQLYSKWKYKGYYSSIKVNNDGDIFKTNGKVDEIYNFKKDSSIYNYSQNFLSGAYDTLGAFTQSLDYNYQKPYLNLPDASDYRILVKFLNGKMYWYFTNYIKHLTKQYK